MEEIMKENTNNDLKPALFVVTSNNVKGDTGIPTGYYLSELTASGMFSETYLRRSIEIVGIDRVLFSTDYPYQYRPGRDARRFFDEMTLDDQYKRKFAYANWERLTRRPSV